MTNIGIVGAGVAGLQLGLYLRQHGIETTIYAERTPEQQLGARIPALVARTAITRERERKLGVNHWDGAHSEFARVDVRLGGEQPMDFYGNLKEAFIAVDMRIYCGRLLEDFAARGGRVIAGPVQASQLERLSEKHDLLIVASGRGGITDLFPRIPEYSPFTAPQRQIMTGIFRGVRLATPAKASITFVPGMGEIFEFPIYSFEPNLTGLGLEAVPGGAFEELALMRYDDDPARFNAAMLELLREHAPEIYARVDPEKFGLTRSLDLLQGGVTPTVRRGYAQLDNGKYVLAVGDAHVVNDPITGQGANTASYVAYLVGEAIVAGPSFDEQFCRTIEQRIWEYAGPVAGWSNAMLQPPEPQMIELLVAATQLQEVADQFVAFFERPGFAYELMSSQERTTEFLQQYGWQGMPQPVAAA